MLFSNLLRNKPFIDLNRIRLKNHSTATIERIFSNPTETSINDKAFSMIQLEEERSAHNYHPVPVVISKGKGVHVWDVNGKQYLDFLSAYSAVNQGHCHPRIVSVMQRQCENLTLTSRAFHNDQFAIYAKFITDMFGYDKAASSYAFILNNQFSFLRFYL
jgi:ornithine--oxo-acid transaminase